MITLAANEQEHYGCQKETPDQVKFPITALKCPCNHNITNEPSPEELEVGRKTCEDYFVVNILASDVLHMKFRSASFTTSNI